MAMFGRLALYDHLHHARDARNGALSASRRRQRAMRAKYPPEVGMIVRLAGVVLAAAILIALVRSAAS